MSASFCFKDIDECATGVNIDCEFGVCRNTGGGAKCICNDRDEEVSELVDSLGGKLLMYTEVKVILFIC